MICKEIKNEKQQTRNVKMILLLKTLLPRLVALVPFVVPIVGDKTLLVWELSSGPTAEALQVSRAGAEGGVEEASNWAPRGTASAPHLPVVSAERNLSSRADLSSQLAPTDF